MKTVENKIRSSSAVSGHIFGRGVNSYEKKRQRERTIAARATTKNQKKSVENGLEK